MLLLLFLSVHRLDARIVHVHGECLDAASAFVILRHIVTGVRRDLPGVGCFVHRDLAEHNVIQKDREVY